MGWSSGSLVGSAVERALKPYLERFTEAELLSIGRGIVKVLEDLDADDLDECAGFVGDAANRGRHEAEGASAEPQVGDTVNYWGETRTFNGKRWVYSEPE